MSTVTRPALVPTTRAAAVLQKYFTTVVRVVLLLGVTACLVATIWPRGESGNVLGLLDDIRERQVVEIEWGSDIQFGQVGPRVGGSWDVTRVRWRVADDDAWKTFTTDDSVVPNAGSDDAELFRDSSDSVLRAINDELLAIPEQVRPELQHRSDIFDFLSWWYGLQAIVILALLASPQPRWATKWAWFWLFALPFGVGLFLYLLFEAPWSRRAATRLREPLPPIDQRKSEEGDRRFTGGWAWLLTYALLPFLGSLLP